MKIITSYLGDILIAAGAVILAVLLVLIIVSLSGCATPSPSIRLGGTDVKCSCGDPVEVEPKQTPVPRTSQLTLKD